MLASLCVHSHVLPIQRGRLRAHIDACCRLVYGVACAFWRALPFDRERARSAGRAQGVTGVLTVPGIGYACSTGRAQGVKAVLTVV